MRPAFKGYAGTNGLSCPSGTDCSNGPLQSGWDSEKWPRAAEIIRYGKTSSGATSGWSTAQIGSNYAFRLNAAAINNVTYHAEVGSDKVCSFNLPLGGN